MLPHFTSDTHFFHERQILWRGFESVDSMHTAMVNAWNAKVGPRDPVWHLGDFSFGNFQNTLEMVDALNGTIKIVPGNHDSRSFLFRLETKLGARKFEVLEPLVTAKVPYDLPGVATQSQRFVLCHFPMLGWDRSHYGVPHLHGHSHGNMRYPFPEAKIMDVGIDAVPEGRPLDIHEVIARLADRVATSCDHHAVRSL